jgi:type II secretory pathway component GspD/PulD (secretin)
MRIIAVLLGLTLAAQAAGEETDRIKVEIEKEMPVEGFLELISQATAHPVLFDPNGQRIRDQKMGARIAMEIPKAKLFDTFRSILTFYEITLVPVGPKGYETYFAIDSRSTNNFIKNKAIFVESDEVQGYADKDGLYISSFIPVEHIENVTTLRTALSTMVSPAGIGRVHEIPGVGILLMDFAPTVAAMQRIIRKMDVPSDQAQVLESIELIYANASEVADSVQELFLEIPATPEPSRARRAIRLPDPAPRIVPFRSRNALLVRSTLRQLETIRGLVAKLDQQDNQRGASEIVRLSHVQATDLADVLTVTLMGPATADWPLRIVPESHTNSLLLNGDRNAIAAVKEMIKLIDVPAAK